MNTLDLDKYKKRIFLLSLIVFLISLTQPAFYIDREDFDAWSSPFGLLLIGWLPIIAGETSAIAWMANPILLLSWISIFNPKLEKAVLWTGLLSIIVGLSFLSVKEILSSEAPTYSKITAIMPGYWLWISSMLTFTVGVLYLKWFKRSKKKKVEETQIAYKVLFSSGQRLNPQPH